MTHRLNESYFDKNVSQKKNIETAEVDLEPTFGFEINLGMMNQRRYGCDIVKLYMVMFERLTKAIKHSRLFKNVGDVRLCVSGLRTATDPDTDDEYDEVFDVNVESFRSKDCGKVFDDIFHRRIEDEGYLVTMMFETHVEYASVSYDVFCREFGKLYGLFRNMTSQESMNTKFDDISYYVILPYPTEERHQYVENPDELMMLYAYANIFGADPQNENWQIPRVNYKYNGALDISDCCDCPASDFHVGDVLYASFGGEFSNVSHGQQYVPIAICANDESVDGTRLFVSLNFMNPHTPETGSRHAYQMPWSSFKNAMSMKGMQRAYGDTNNGQKTGAQCFSEHCQFLNSNKEGNRYHGGRFNSGLWIGSRAEGGAMRIFPVMCACEYHTQGTKKGDWYIPSAYEMTYMTSEENWMKVQEARKKIVGEYYVTDKVGVWTSSEANKSYVACCAINTNRGMCGAEEKDYINASLAFLTIK